MYTLWKICPLSNASVGSKQWWIPGWWPGAWSRSGLYPDDALCSESELTACWWEHHSVQLTQTQALGTSSRASGSTNAWDDGDSVPALLLPVWKACDLEGNKKVILQKERVSGIIVAPTNPIINVVTQPALLERNICNRKWADHSPVSDGAGFRSLCGFFKTEFY